MRHIFIAIIILLLIYIVKTDLSADSLSYAANMQEKTCAEQTDITYIPVQLHDGDTIQTLFALHPMDENISFLERLTLFYNINPHLRKQPLIAGEFVKLPITNQLPDTCHDEK